MLFKPMETTHAAYIEEIYKGSTLFSKIGETQAVPISTPVVANKLTTYIQDFAEGIELSKNLFDDNLHGVWARTVTDFARVARVTQDDNAFAFFRGAFTTSLTADGAAIAGAHTLIGGGTNTTLVSGAFTPSTLNDAIVAMRQQKNHAGVIMGNTPSVLLVPSPLYKKALEITESALIADSANNNLNVFRSAYGITVLTSPYLDAVASGSDTAWFLLSRNHSVTRLIRQGLVTNLRDWSFSNNRTYFYQANFREAVYAPDYVGFIASTGL